jgi:hypothetical protein
MKRIDTCVDENGSAGGEGYVHSEYMNLYFISNLEYAVLLKMKKKKNSGCTAECGARSENPSSLQKYLRTGRISKHISI